MAEGWVIIKGERRFIPLGRKPRRRHAKSCLYHRNPDRCALNPDTICDPEAEACDAYVNRTWGQRNENP
jgi:hypothetical protein